MRIHAIPYVDKLSPRMRGGSEELPLSQNFGMPSIGRLHKYEEPRGIPGVRCDSGAGHIFELISTVGSVLNLESFVTEDPDPRVPTYFRWIFL